MEKLEETCKKLPLVALLLHGSRATGHSRQDSDFDFAYLARYGVDTAPVENSLLPALAQAFGCDEALVDLQDLRSSPPHFRVRTLHYGRTLYVADPTELARFYTSSLSMDRDTQYFTRPFREALRQRIRDGEFAS